MWLAVIIPQLYMSLLIVQLDKSTLQLIKLNSLDNIDITNYCIIIIGPNVL